MSHYKTGHKQPRFRYSVLARCVAWANISVQVLFPLAVTFTPVMAARAQHAVQPRLSMGNTTVTADNNVEKNVASFAANAGTFLSSQPDSDATRNFITGMATAKANQEIQEWLGKYGTARVKLNVDKDFSLKDSSLEMLYPIYDTPTNMLFTQGAIHRTDDRTQSNIGFGWRHFSGNDWMAGVNTFIDHDLSRSHTRIGVGAEYWRDYLKLSANGYIRASGWKKSPDIEDYQERPANGWDIRAEGYLPAWPQLGASLMYEQYYGDEVGLFGKDKRQKDPHAISAEVTYTPVPLLTLSAGHKQGKLGVKDEPLTLLKNVRGLELLTFAEQDTCCGFGGTFSVKMAEISGEMVKEKVAHLMEVRPEYLIGADVSCLLNISGRLQREGQKVKVMHIAEVLMSR
ncbi:inverse autotransporter beta domain-containing protein [Escherichia coli]|nr:inverse autotransporter beta domain-containing protein [Escherichia coli]MDT8938334.1 inverse autotransporter beta domain-containing protein [Escherichia coli]MDW2494601.1 inverse autotransporter beta domain-containing protein [Escherichia coli]MDW2508627.1 inverse autotransporter beta domain-containing protein [Escherichia coli]MDW2561482.1 inverse autotransporter beta domain-containing protein [Escherichia coli]MDW2566302.1 inverse autotransporter beta domain-containing protein [Escherich